MLAKVHNDTTENTDGTGYTPAAAGSSDSSTSPSVFLLCILTYYPAGYRLLYVNPELATVWKPSQYFDSHLIQ
ncbi:unnamed protein product [Enterobius vermicularis]|uniref:Uncharacterized protein n=1 Tax=Enterobius vermicularis TaxID=51028 RepID=A0A0N4V3W4_ENTVE|nr:unnamed protein product [Enterobius vermicularis]